MRFNKITNGKEHIFLLIIFVILASVFSFIFISLKSDTDNQKLKENQVIKSLFVVEDKDQVLFTDIFIYYPVSKKGALINILGNTGAIFQSIGRVDRIDAVYTEKGIETYKSEIEKLIGQEIPFYIDINLSKFSELTDLLGGLKVFVPSPVDIKKPDGDYWLLPSGAVTLDGDKIVTYLDYLRPEESEEELQERRQNVMVSFLSSLKNNLKKIKNKEVFSYFFNKMKSNLEEEELRKLLIEISNVDSESIVPQNITGAKRVVDGKVLLFPYYDGQLIKDVVMQAMTSLTSLDDTKINRIYVLEIQNGTTVQGLARNTAALLKSAGYDVLSTINADRNDYEETKIINHIGNIDIAKNLGNFIHCTNIIEESVKPESSGIESDSNVDFTIILGKDFDGRYVK